MSMTVSLHYGSGDPSPDARMRVLAGGPTVSIGGYPQTVDLHLSAPTQARDLAAAMVAAARCLDAWADEADPDPDPLSAAAISAACAEMKRDSDAAAAEVAAERDYDTAKPGDASFPLHYMPLCGHVALTSGHRVCTRPDGHTGQHVAEGTRKVLEVWPQTTVVSVRLDDARQTTADELLRSVTADPLLWDRLPRRVVAALAAQAEATERVAS